ncbi:MAG: hypothetical protein AAF745_01980 [Planctomycetota bacterium]
MTQSLQCPACKAAVTVGEDAGGQRVSCPHCDSTFVVPGSTSLASGDDDDWLSLDDPFAESPVGPDTVRTSMPEPSVSGALPEVEPTPSANRGDDFGDDLFDMALPSAAPPTQSSPSAPPSGSAQPVQTQSATAQSVEFETHFRITCRTCGSPIGVTAAQTGRQIKCRDCHCLITVPSPPRKKKKPQIDLDSAATFTFEESLAIREDRPADPYRKSAQDLLAEAEAVEESTPAEDDDDVPKIGEWLRSTFGILTQLGVLTHWLILSAVGGLVGGIVVGVGTDILLMSLFPLGLFFAAMTLACGFAILQSVANDEDSVDQWPLTLEPAEWISPLLLCLTAVGLTVGPVWFAASIAFEQSITTVFICMASLFVLFPFVLLSMLDMQSVFVPFSPEVGRSITRCEEAWGGFYFSAAILFFATFLIFVFASLQSAVATLVIALTTGVAATFVYFALIGRLAYAIGQSVNEKPMVNDIDSVREAERRRGTN